MYLHPKVGINGPGEANLQKELTAATQAKNFFNKGMGPIFMGVNVLSRPGSPGGSITG